MGKKRKLTPKSEPEPTSVHEQEEQLEEQHMEEQISFEAEEEEPQANLPEDIEEPEEYEEEEDEEEEEGEEEEEEEEMDDETTDAPNSSNATASVTAITTANPEEHALADDDGDETLEPVQTLLEPFTKEQLIDILGEASDKHSDILDRIRKLANVDPVHRKIFVHGLGWDTNAEVLTNAFKKYGEIEDFNVVCDKVSGKSKGYGFILFKHRSGARKALKEPQKLIGNRMTACQLASAGPVPPPAPAAPPASEYTQRKIYVSNVSADIDPQRLSNFFAKYGEIEEGPLGIDKQTGKFKGFTLFVYKSSESAKKALEESHKSFDGNILHCQKAIDGPKLNKPFFTHHQPHPTGSGRGSHFLRNENSSAAGGSGHMMAPSAPAMTFNQGASQSLNPVLGQAITALLATQGAGLGLTNLLGTLGSTAMGPQGNQPVSQMVNNVGHGMQVGYGNQAVGSNIGASVMGGYRNQPAIQGGYSKPQIGQANSSRSHQGGHMGGVPPYMGH